MTPNKFLAICSVLQQKYGLLQSLRSQNQRSLGVLQAKAVSQQGIKPCLWATKIAGRAPQLSFPDFYVYTDFSRSGFDFTLLPSEPLTVSWMLRKDKKLLDQRQRTWPLMAQQAVQVSRASTSVHWFSGPLGPAEWQPLAWWMRHTQQVCIKLETLHMGDPPWYRKYQASMFFDARWRLYISHFKHISGGGK